MTGESFRPVLAASAFAVVAWPCASTPAMAQHPVVLQKLQAWNAAAPQPEERTLAVQVTEAARKIYPDAGRCLEQGLRVGEVRPATADRYAFNELVYARLRNAWTVTVRHDGCDPAPVRYMVIQKLDGAFSTTRVNRGESYAHDSLIGDALLAAVPTAHLILSRAKVACRSDEQFKLGVTRIDKEEPGLGPDVFGVRYRGSWSEVWPIEVCGRAVEVTVSFTADGDGGAYYRTNDRAAVLLPSRGADNKP